MNQRDYQNQLIFKLNTLIATLSLAIARLERVMNRPDTAEQGARLAAVHHKLTLTKQTCENARDKLMSYNPDVKPSPEVNSIEEYQKFKKQPPITSDEIKATNLEDLIKRLQQ
ncbi:MAG: hypothetical protein R3330_13890 [Saprospiraceae bacterium]|nr:hypothetical protein [Saprospiraceae bacterium]